MVFFFNFNFDKKSADDNKFIKNYPPYKVLNLLLIDFSLTVKAATLIFISGRGSAISSAKEVKSGSIYNLVKNN